MPRSFDLIVVGGGPGGYVAAIRAAQLGMRTVLVEREHLGGICLNWGCIPTKSLLRSAELYTQMLDAAAYGITVEGVGFDLIQLTARSRAVAGQLSSGVRHLLRKNGVEVVDGHGRLTSAGQLQVTGPGGELTELAAPHVILATGARARTVAPVEFDGKLIWSYKEALVPRAVPKSLLVVGSGAIGIEFASFYAALGAEVTIMEIVDRILPAEDEEISELARKSLSRQGLRVITGAVIKSLDKGEDEVTVTFEAAGQRSTLRVDRLLSAVGVVGNVENLGLEQAGVRVEKFHIVTDAWCRTSRPGVYAIGDVAGAPCLAHKASHEAVLCVERISGAEGRQPLDPRRIPGCIYSRPQVASVGLSERQARESGYELRIGRFPFRANGKAIALGEPEGLVKTIFDAGTGELLGAHMIGAEVTELIQGYVLGMTLEATEIEFSQTVFAHPTLSEAMHEAVLAAFGSAIHV